MVNVSNFGSFGKWPVSCDHLPGKGQSLCTLEHALNQSIEETGRSLQRQPRQPRNTEKVQEVLNFWPGVGLYGNSIAPVYISPNLTKPDQVPPKTET